MTSFVQGKNNLRVVASNAATTVTDEIDFLYQIDRWKTPSI
ncbi:MAG TPA: hypothetical protein VMU57_09485 [Edaphobacter sp.]|nr:hypothetical protein [Edaphobacter sp.]HUZ95133.1 hypothetical protein [Edaphobacter sp.]